MPKSFIRSLFFFPCAAQGDADVAEDIVDGSGAFDGVVFAFGGIEVTERGGLLIVDFEAVFDCLWVVVAASALGTALYEAVDKFVVVDFESHDCVDFRSATGKHIIESLCLLNGAGESIEDHAGGRLRVIVECVVEDVNHKIVGDQLAAGDVFVGHTAELGVARYVVAEQLAGGYMVKSIFVDHSCALSALATSGSAKHY